MLVCVNVFVMSCLYILRVPQRTCLELRVIDLFSLFILFSQCRSCDNTPENCFFQQILSYSRVYVRRIYQKIKGQAGPLRPLLGKQNVQAKDVY